MHKNICQSEIEIMFRKIVQITKFGIFWDFSFLIVCFLPLLCLIFFVFNSWQSMIIFLLSVSLIKFCFIRFFKFSVFGRENKKKIINHIVKMIMLKYSFELLFLVNEAYENVCKLLETTIGSANLSDLMTFGCRNLQNK